MESNSKRTFVCSDLHGYKNLFDQLLEAIEFGVGACRNDEMHILGDIIDRGPDSIALLKQIMCMRNTFVYLGNHELMMLDTIQSRKNNHVTGNPDIWMLETNGGIETKRAFFALPQPEQDRIQEYLEQCWIQRIVEADGEKYWLSHSAILDTEEYPEGDYRYMHGGEHEVSWEDAFRVAWSSPFRSDEYADPSEYKTDRYTHIIGHVPAIRITSDMPPVLNWGRPLTGSNFVDTIFGMGRKNESRTNYPIVDIDGGCAIIPALQRVGLLDGVPVGLFCMQLEKEADGSHRCWMSGSDGIKEESLMLTM